MVLIKKLTVDENGNVNECFICDGQYILPDTYYTLEEELELEEYMDFEDDYTGELAEYNYDEPCDCVDCTIDRYVDKISSLGLVCPHCIRECLESFVDELLDK